MELANEIEKDREKIQRGEEVSGQGSVMSSADEGIRSPLVSLASSGLSSHGAEDVQPLELTKRPDGEGDVKMEDT